MRFVFIGAGAVGGYYGALLQRSGQDVSVIARGAHLDAIRRRGLRVVGPLGDFTVPLRAESDPAKLGPTDVVVLTVKTYDNATAIPLITPLVGPGTVVLTVQNGVDSAEEVARVVGEAPTIAGATYIATAVESPGVIRQTGTHRRIVFGECFGAAKETSKRVAAIEPILKAADIHAEAVADARPAIWEKFTYLAPFAAFTGASRLPLGPLWGDPYTREMFVAAVAEVVEVAKAYGVVMAADHLDRMRTYVSGIPPTTRSSLLIDLSQGKRIEVEALQGSVVRRGQAKGVSTPIMASLYAVLKPHAAGPPVVLGS
jgi:2-dehydropantoate 2-reductase